MKRSLDTPMVIRDLSVDERVMLVQDIWDSILEEEGESFELTDAERQELDRRLDNYRANKGNLSTWDEVKQRMLSRE